MCAFATHRRVAPRRAVAYDDMSTAHTPRCEGAGATSLTRHRGSINFEALVDNRDVKNTCARPPWIALLVLIGVAVTMTLSTRRVLRSAAVGEEEIAHVQALSDLDTAIVELDDYARDYAATGSSLALEQYRASRSAVEDAALRVRAIGDPEGRLLSEPIQGHRERLDALVSARLRGNIPIMGVDDPAEHRRLMKRLRALVAELDDHSRVEQAERDARTRAVVLEFVAQLVGLLTSLGLLCVWFRRLRREVDERRRIAAELEAANDRLESRVSARTAELLASNERLQAEMLERERAMAVLRDTQQQLQQSQKLEVIGQLAGGIAHDFNNLLSVILSYSEMLMENMKDPGQCDDMREIRNAGMRAAELTRQLLAFSRRQVLAPRVIDPNKVVDGMSKMLNRVLGEHVELRVVRASAARVMADPSQIEQVILNLALNARDAMPTGGTLTIETADVVLDSDYAASHVDVIPGPYVMLAVGDTGTGMDATTQARIFEPFFTTKPVGKGTGLGLSMVFGIVKQSRGSIEVHSEPGRGTTFKIYLPVVDRPSDAPQPDLVGEAARGTERILLVEDDAALRALARSALSRAGYHVVAAADGEEALAIWKSATDPFDLLLTDIAMPRLNGRPLAEALSGERPRLPVIFMSGYTDDEVLREGVVAATMYFLQKPFARDRLLRTVRDALDRAPPIIVN